MALGKHVILECYDCDANMLSNQEYLNALFVESAENAGATVLHSYFHKFDQGNGITGVVALSESHISVHTWPEHQYMAIDVFMCGTCDPMDAVDYIISNVGIGAYSVDELIRGEQFTFHKQA